MLKASIVLTFAFLCLASVTGLLLGITFSRSQRSRYPILRKLDGKQIHLFLLTLVFLVLGYGSYSLKEWLTVKLSIELSQGPQGELSQKATENGFARELKEAASELEGRARDFFKAAERDFASRRYRDAAGGYQKSLDALPTMSAYLNLGTSLFNTSNLKEAGDAFSSGLRLAQTKRNREFEAAFLERIGIVCDQKGELDEALRSYNAALEVYNQAPSPAGRATVLGNIGNVQFTKGMPDQALRSYQTALEIFRKNDSKLGEAAALGNIGTIYSSEGRLDEGLKTYHQAVEIYKRIDDPLGQASIGINIGIVYKRQGKYEDAVKAQLAALDLGRQIDSPHIRALALVNMGQALHEQGKYQKALESFRSAADISKQTGELREEARALVHLGWAYGIQGNLEEGLRNLQAALKIFQDIDSPLDQEDVTFRMADIYFQNRSIGEELKYSQALMYYEAALEIAKRIGHLSGQASAFGGIGAVFASLNKPKEATENFQRKLDISRSINDPSGEADALSMAGMVYYALNKNSEALNLLSQARAIYIRTGLEPNHLKDAERFIREIDREQK